mgnify:CR=1 FL=1
MTLVHLVVAFLSQPIECFRWGAYASGTLLSSPKTGMPLELLYRSPLPSSWWFSVLFSGDGCPSFVRRVRLFWGVSCVSFLARGRFFLGVVSTYLLRGFLAGMVVLLFFFGFAFFEGWGVHLFFVGVAFFRVRVCFFLDLRVVCASFVRRVLLFSGFFSLRRCVEYRPTNSYIPSAIYYHPIHPRTFSPFRSWILPTSIHEAKRSGLD